MTHARLRPPVAPLRRARDARRALPSVQEAVALLQPSEPLHCLRPALLRQLAADFVAAFPGDVLYAAKCNPDPAVLRALHDGGIGHFDVASAAEIALVARTIPSAELHYMHPVKPRPAIRAAYERHGCRSFALDSLAELMKIGDETGGARDLTLVVRLALPKSHAVCDLSGKFGAEPEAAVELLRAARRLAAQLGVSFHVGSQCLEPDAYERALAMAGRVVTQAGVPIEIIDVGGGFPAAYPGMEAPPPADYFAAIARGRECSGLPRGARLWAEPGRALVAPGASVVVQVEARRGQELYVNDGAYGSLADAGRLGMRYPARLIRPGGGSTEPLMPFAFFGPTCDSADRMAGPFLLPADMREGDWIELGQLGAYGASLRTAFNGFDRAETIEVRDPALTESAALSLQGMRRRA